MRALANIRLIVLCGLLFMVDYATALTTCNIAPPDSIIPVPDGVTAETILDKYFEAVGGSRRMRKFDHVTIDQKTKFNDSMVLQIVRYKKEPDKYLKIIKTGDVEFEKWLLNGSKAWRINRSGTDTLTALQVAALKNEAQVFPELRYEKYGYKTELLGAIKEERSLYYMIKVTAPDDKVYIDYYDDRMGFKHHRIELVQIEDGSIAEITTTYLNYVDYKKVRFPRVIVTDFFGSKIKMSVEYDFKKKISDTIFLIETYY